MDREKPGWKEAANKTAAIEYAAQKVAEAYTQKGWDNLPDHTQRIWRRDAKLIIEAYHSQLDRRSFSPTPEE